jgi:RNA polymerase sigma-70 factor (ECF subfamily)
VSSAEDAYRQHRGRIYRFFRSRVASHDDAEDLTQRVFLDAVVALSEGKPAPDSVLGWLYAVAQRRLVDEIRRRNRAATVAMQASPPTRGADYGSDVTGHLARALANLPDTQRRVVALRLLRGVPFSEISTEIGISEAAAKMRFTRGIQQVRRHLIESGLDGRDP